MGSFSSFLVKATFLMKKIYILIQSIQPIGILHTKLLSLKKDHTLVATDLSLEDETC